MRAWIEGMFAQATDSTAAARTRPFILNVYRLMEQYPAEKRRSIAVLGGAQVAGVVRRGSCAAGHR